ncbi:MAG: hypothetical protein GY847_28825 [Proteobacteria bacterium]|nr:hypothetical protein [Pseudomonadota bacterium]
MGFDRDILKMCRRVVDALLGNVRTTMPARVVSYDSDLNTVSIQPCINLIRPDDPNNLTTVPMAQVDDVPVKQQGSGKLLFSIAPQVGSYGGFTVSDRSIEQWLTKGGIVDPTSAKKHDPTDGIFDPGWYPLVADGNNGMIATGINTDRAEIRTRLGTSYVSLKDDGTVELTTLNNATVTLATSGAIAIENSAGSAEIDASGNVTVDGPVIKVGGSGASEPALQGTKFIVKFNAHTHTTAFGPSGPPVIPWLTTDNSTKVLFG